MLKYLPKYLPQFEGPLCSCVINWIATRLSLEKHAQGLSMEFSCVAYLQCKAKYAPLLDFQENVTTLWNLFCILKLIGASRECLFSCFRESWVDSVPSSTLHMTTGKTKHAKGRYTAVSKVAHNYSKPRKFITGYYFLVHCLTQNNC